MNNELLTMVEHATLECPGVWTKRDENGPGSISVTGCPGPQPWGGGDRESRIEP
jgi:hypothetical protein